MQAKATEIGEQANVDADVDLPKVELDNDQVDLRLDRNSRDSIDNFSGSEPVGDSSSESAKGDFNATGLGLGDGARKLDQSGDATPLQKLEPIDAEPEVEVVQAPLIKIAPEVDEPDVAEDAALTTGIESHLTQINDRLVAIGQSLLQTNQLLGGENARVLTTDAGDAYGLTEDVLRAIVETAANTRTLAERSRGGGLVFA